MEKEGLAVCGSCPSAFQVMARTWSAGKLGVTHCPFPPGGKDSPKLSTMDKAGKMIPTWDGNSEPARISVNMETQSWANHRKTSSDFCETYEDLAAAKSNPIGISKGKSLQLQVQAGQGFYGTIVLKFWSGLRTHFHSSKLLRIKVPSFLPVISIDIYHITN